MLSIRHPALIERFYRNRNLTLVVGIAIIFSLQTASADPLSITSQPQSQIVILGSNVVLSVAATGTPPLSYQWKKSDVALANQTNATLVLNNIQPTNEGTYRVVVSDFSGSVTSSVATLGSTFGIQWQQSFGGNSDDLLYSLKQTTDGGYIFGGYSDSGISGNKTSASFGNSDYWLVKVDATGNKQWEKVFGGSGFDELFSLKQTSDGGYILGGVSDSEVSGNKTNAGLGGFDYWVLKLDTNGNKQWEQSFGGTNADYFSGLQETGDGGYLLGGYSDSGASGNKTNAGFGGFDYWIVRLDATGQKLWEQSFGGSDDDWLNSLHERSGGGYILGGYSISSVSGNKTNAGVDGLDYWVVTVDASGNKLWEQTFSVGDNDDFCVARPDASGNTLWDECFGGTSEDVLYNVQPISYGGYVLGGCSFSEASGNKVSAAFGSGDYWMVGLNSNGNKLWEQAVGGIGNDVLRSLHQSSDGGYILGGYSSSDNSGNKTSIAFGGYDYWVVKLVITSTPVITSHPQSQTNAPGSSVTLTVTASNAFSYQWRKNGDDIPGATASFYTINNFQANHVGRYDVLVRPGEVASSSAYLFISGTETGSPTVSIIAPKANQRITNNFNFTMTGTAKDMGLGVAQVFYRLNGGPLLLANGTTDWSAVLTLIPGPNIIEVHALDFGGNDSSVVSRTFSEVIFSQLALTKTGVGTIVSTPSDYGTPTNGAQLEVGRSYEIQAIPGLNNVFSNWTGSATSPDATADFIMQSNMTLNANFVVNPFVGVVGSYNGLFQESNITHQTAGFFTMKVKTNFAFSGKVILDGDAIVMSGKFDVDGTVTKLLPRAKLGKPDLTLALALDFANGTDHVTGSVSSDNWTASLEADRAIFSTANPATNYTNSYTMLLPGLANPTNGPPGYGYGLVKIKPNGFAVLAGETADGMRMSQSVSVSKNGQWPLYVFLYKSTRNYTNWVTQLPAVDKSYYLGSSYGWVTFANNTPTGTITLIKTGQTNTVYPTGFTNEAVLLGERYSRPPSGTQVMIMTNGTITLTNGNLSSALAGSVFIKPNNSVMVTNNYAIKFSLAAGTGLISGSFQNPNNGNAITTFKGAVLQGQNAGAGHFLGTNQSGLFLVEGD